MKLKTLTLALLCLPIIAFAQSELSPDKGQLSFTSSFTAQFTDFSDLNEQLEDYQVPVMENVLGALAVGVQYRIPNSVFSTSFEAFYLESCPDHNPDIENSAVVKGGGAKLKQSMVLFEKNGWTLNPAIGVGYQQMCLKVEGDHFEQTRMVGFSEKVCSNNFFTDWSLGFEKKLNRERSKNLYLGSNLGYRRPINKSVTNEEVQHVGWSSGNLKGMTLDFTVRFELF